MESLLKKDYEDGFKRLVFINHNCSRSDEPGGGSKDNELRNICVVCGYTWKGKSIDNMPKICPKCRSSLWNVKGLHHFSCSMCGHEWVSRKEYPSACPSCKSKMWRGWTNHYVCGDCGYILNAPQKSNVLERCPRCDSVNWKCEYVCCVCRKCGYVGVYKMDRPGRCPICKTTVYGGKAGSSDPGFHAVACQFDIDSRVVEILKDYTHDKEMEVLDRLLNCGINDEEAGIMLRHIRGCSDIEIAREMNVAYGTVRMIIGVLNSKGIGSDGHEIYR